MSGSFSKIYDRIKSMLGLQLDSLKLTVAEKLTELMTALMLVAVAFVFGIAVLVCVTIGLADLLSAVMPIFLAYLILAVVYALLFLAIYHFRTPLLLDPIARAITRWMLKPPTAKDKTPAAGESCELPDAETDDEGTDTYDNEERE